jgi:hypothetical protein
LDNLKKQENDNEYNIQESTSIIEGTKEFGKFIFSLVEEFYKDFVKCINLNLQNNWTVVSALIMERKKNFKIVGFALGTKSLGNKLYESSGIRIKDGHAEILVLRCFRKLLMDLINKVISQQELDEFFNIFVLSHDKKIRIKNDVKFHLYISELPCGDCSLYPIKYNDSIEINRIGAKTLANVISNNNSMMNHNNNPGLVRIKSCRSDIKVENISYSISCSDKLLLRNTLGIQGRLMSSLCENIFLSSIVISVEYNDEFIQKNKFESIVLRGLCLSERLHYLEKLDELNTSDYELYINLSKIIFVQDKLFHKNDSVFNFSYYWYYGKNDIGKIDPTSGLKQGSSKKDSNILKYNLDISDYYLKQTLICLLNTYLKSDIYSNSYFNLIIRKIEKYLLKNDKKIENFSYFEIKSIMKKYNYSKKKLFLERILGLHEFKSFKELKNE